MTKKFEPNDIKQRSRQLPVDPDADWIAIATKVPLVPKVNVTIRRQEFFIPAVPHSFIREADAGDALELLLVAIAHMRMNRVTEIPINKAIWRKVGDPSRRVRSRLLKQLAELSPELCTLTIRKGRPALLVAGPKWPKPHEFAQSIQKARH